MKECEEGNALGGHRSATGTEVARLGGVDEYLTVAARWRIDPRALH